MAEIQYSARFQSTTLIERGRANTLQCPVYRAGALVAPTVSGSSVSIYDQSDTLVVSAAAITVSGSVATYTSGTLASSTLGEGWRIEWDLVMPDGVTHTYRNTAALVRCIPAPPATEADLYRRVPSLNPADAAVIHSATDFAEQLDEAWLQIGERLLSQGNRPWLVINSSSLRMAHTLLTLAIIFEGFASRLNPAYLEQSKMYREQYGESWAGLVFQYDRGDTGKATSRRSAQATVWLTSRGDQGPRR